MTNQALIERIQDSIDFLELVKEYVPSVKKAGRVYMACCPFHQEKTPSFSISPEKGLYYCFGCQAGGNLIQFYMKVENLSFPEALRRLAERAGIPWQEESYAMTEQEKLRLKDLKLMTAAKDFYHRQLLSEQGAQARQYLESRNITPQTIEKFQLGVSFLNTLTEKATQSGYNLSTLQKLGLTSAYGNSDYFKNRLMFPIINHRGDCVGFGGRTLNEAYQPKYLNSPETRLFSKSRVLYGLNFAGPAIRRENRAVLLEGYMDVIACHQAGADNCVAPLGTAFTAQHAKLLKRYTDTVIVLFDPDSAGVHASMRAAMILIENEIYVKVASLSEGLDPDEYIHKYGLDKFKQVLNEAKDIINFRLDCILKGAQNISAKDKADISAEIIEIIQKQPDAIIKNEWVMTAANRLGIEPEIIKQKVSKTPLRVKSQQPETVKIQARDNTPQSEIDLIKLLLKYPRYTELCAELTQKHFENKNIWLILKEIEVFRKQRPDIEDIVPYICKDNEALAKLALKYALSPLPEGLRPQKEIEACLRTISKTALMKRFKEVQRLLAGYPPGQAPTDLLKEQIEIQKKLKS